MEEEFALRLSSSFGAGMGRLRAVECAARMGQELLEQKKLQKK